MDTHMPMVPMDTMERDLLMLSQRLMLIPISCTEDMALAMQNLRIWIPICLWCLWILWKEIGISISLWLSISRSLSIVSIGTIGIWVTISVGSVSKTISIEIGISISLWLSISRSLSIVSIGVWVSSISVMS